MPRRKTAVKSIKSIGAVDLHFHGAFGLDLMRATPAEMTELSHQLWKNQVAGFCATTLSTPPKELREAVTRMGSWIRSGRHPGAKPLGIHLEGPFISPHACGAHPPKTIRPLDSKGFKELENLWEASRETLKILTIAPETLKAADLKKLAKWARARKIKLSLGHSRAGEKQANDAFSAGFSGVTHAWNALNFHHRSPGVMGAAIGRKDISLELIIDQVHVSPTLIRWTTALHDEVAFVSDCVPAAATRAGSWHTFGPLKVAFKDGACRVAAGHLAGGGVLLPEAFRKWVKHEADFTGRKYGEVLRQNLRHITSDPLAAIGLTPKNLADRPVLYPLTAQ